MTRARDSLIDLDSTSYFHCISRCVRMSYLCGDDKFSGQNFDHRREWLVERFKFLSSVFSIDLAAYSVMESHYHLVLKVNRDQAIAWSDNEVIERWYRLYNGNHLVDCFRAGDELDEASLYAVKQSAKKWRNRLYDISWYMRNVNEFIARKANKEDDCKGRFWEGRFKSQALLDETAVLSCMVYVDLNPIRAKMTDSLITSDFTSIQQRIKQLNAYKNAQKKSTKTSGISVPQQPSKLLAFGSNHVPKTIPFKLYDYLELADWSGRLINPKKRGAISAAVPKILSVLGIEQDSWLETIKNFRRKYANFAGSKASLMKCAHAHNHSWYKGVG